MRGKSQGGKSYVAKRGLPESYCERKFLQAIPVRKRKHNDAETYDVRDTLPRSCCGTVLVRR